MVDQVHWFPPLLLVWFLYALSSGDVLVAPRGKAIDTLDIQNAWLAMQCHMPNENGGDSFHCMTNRFDPQLHIHKDKLRTPQNRFHCRLRCHHRQELPNPIFGIRILREDYPIVWPSLQRPTAVLWRILLRVSAQVYSLCILPF